MSKQTGILLLICIACLAGCQNHPPAAAVQQQSLEVSQDLSARYDEANQIWDLTEKDLALRKIARDATGENVPEIALKAAGGMSDLSLKDETAGASALAFYDRGNRNVAMKLVGMISDASIRDEIAEQVTPAQTMPTPTTPSGAMPGKAEPSTQR